MPIASFDSLDDWLRGKPYVMEKKMEYIDTIREKTKTSNIANRDSCLDQVRRSIENTAAVGGNKVVIRVDYPKHIKYVKEILINEGFTVIGGTVSW